MGEQITNAEWEKISPDNFETASLLRAVDAIDDLRGDFNDGEYSAPPQIRTDLLRLHEIAMAVINEGSRSRVSALFELASDLDEQISHLGGVSPNRRKFRHAKSRAQRVPPPTWISGSVLLTKVSRM